VIDETKGMARTRSRERQTKAAPGSSVRDADASSEFYLQPIPPELRHKAVTYLADGDVEAFLSTATNEAGLALVFANTEALQRREVYEQALVCAFTSTRTSNRRWTTSVLAELFKQADRQRLRAAGEPLPGPGPFTVYRGVAGCGRARRVRGFSWTLSEERAGWFANRYALPDPAVYQATVDADDVLFYYNGRSENEIVVLPASLRHVHARELRSVRPDEAQIVADLRALGMSRERALAQARAEIRKGLHAPLGPL
jgi:hypothetical protein